MIESDDNPHEILDSATSKDPGVSLPAIARLKEIVEDLESDAVNCSVIESWSWKRIGDALNRPKQEVWAKHHDPEEEFMEGSGYDDNDEFS